MARKKGLMWWYVVYWINKGFIKSKHYKPHKIGTVFGSEEPSKDRQRIGFDDKKKDFVIIEKQALIMLATKEEFLQHMKKTST